jgi:hypothetical protein
LPGATTTSTNKLSGRGELIAKIGTVVSAVVASSCCWLPVLLLAVGVSGAGIATALEAYRPLFMVVTFGFLGMAFYFTYRPRHATAGQADCCAAQPVDGPQAAAIIKRPRFNMMALNKIMLWAVTLLAVVFLFFPQFVTGLLGAGNDAITADMTQTVIKVEGMTCKG